MKICIDICLGMAVCQQLPSLLDHVKMHLEVAHLNIEGGKTKGCQAIKIFRIRYTSSEGPYSRYVETKISGKQTSRALHDLMSSITETLEDRTLQ